MASNNSMIEPLELTAPIDTRKLDLDERENDLNRREQDLDRRELTLHLCEEAVASQVDEIGGLDQKLLNFRETLQKVGMLKLEATVEEDTLSEPGRKYSEGRSEEGGLEKAESEPQKGDVLGGPEKKSRKAKSQKHSPANESGKNIDTTVKPPPAGYVRVHRSGLQPADFFANGHRTKDGDIDIVAAVREVRTHPTLIIGPERVYKIIPTINGDRPLRVGRGGFPFFHPETGKQIAVATLISRAEQAEIEEAMRNTKEAKVSDEARTKGNPTDSGKNAAKQAGQSRVALHSLMSSLGFQSTDEEGTTTQDANGRPSRNSGPFKTGGRQPAFYFAGKHLTKDGLNHVAAFREVQDPPLLVHQGDVVYKVMPTQQGDPPQELRPGDLDCRLPETGEQYAVQRLLDGAESKELQEATRQKYRKHPPHMGSTFTRPTNSELVTYRNSSGELGYDFLVKKATKGGAGGKEDGQEMIKQKPSSKSNGHSSKLPTSAYIREAEQLSADSTTRERLRSSIGPQLLGAPGGANQISESGASKEDRIEGLPSTKLESAVCQVAEEAVETGSEKRASEGMKAKKGLRASIWAYEE